jgi:serine/threonine protein kinase
MKIHYLNPEGVHEAEKEPLTRLAESLPSTWKGYASLELIDRRQGNAEIDLVIVNHDRLIVVELKNWNGELRSSNGNWFVGEDDRGRSPVKATDLKRKKLASRIRKKFPSIQVPWVDFCIVLCGSSRRDSLPDDERDFVHHLEDFCFAGKPKNYENMFPALRFPPRSNDQRPNSNLGFWDKFFIGNGSDFQPRVYSFNNYIARGTQLFEHQKKIYKEFEAYRRDDSNYRALMRRWNFAAPDILGYAQTADERRQIGYRESKVLGYIDNQDETLKDAHLALLHVPRPEDITVDFCELYEWPRNRLRLDEFVNKNKKRLTPEKRLDLIKVLLSHVASLHDIDVAHRDIGRHSVWLALPTRITLSNFLTAAFPNPDNTSLQSVRTVLQAGRAEIPDDLFEDEDGTPFTRDVYLTGAVAHYIAYGQWPSRADGVFTWKPHQEDPYGGALDNWFARMLELAATDRFPNMSVALDELNRCTAAFGSASSADPKELDQHISDVNVWPQYQPEVVEQKGTSMLLRSGCGTHGIKLWNGVSQLIADRSVNHHLLVFLRRVQQVANARIDSLATVQAYGFNPTMQNLFVVYEWQDGPTWEYWIKSGPRADELMSQLPQLARAVVDLHRAHLSHGDLHPGNIIVRERDGERAPILIDFLDYLDHTRDIYNTAYTPDNRRSLTVEAIDRYAVTKVIAEGAERAGCDPLAAHCTKLLSQPEVSSGDLARLVEQFESISSPPSVTAPPRHLITGHRLGEGLLLSDDGVYYMSAKDGTDNRTGAPMLRLYISGVQQQIDLHLELTSGSVLRVFPPKDITHNQYIRNKRNATCEVTAVIETAPGMGDEAGSLVSEILEHPSVKQLIEGVSPAAQDEQAAAVEVAPLEIATCQLWEALVATEDESYPAATIERSPEFLPNNDLLIHYSTEGPALDFDLQHDAVWVKAPARDGYRRLGRLVEYSGDALRVTSVRNAASLGPGDTLRLESGLAASSLSKRKRAIDDLIRGHAVIRRLPDYFDGHRSIDPIQYAPPPTDAELDAYTATDAAGKVTFALNEQQRAAFRNLYSSGPVSLLQGPPGTGKTAFISSFIHHCVSNGANKILLVSQSHEAVNNAAETTRELFARFDSHIEIVRLGNEGTASVALADVHENALQAAYRDKFQAEYKERLCQMAAPLGLPQSFVEDCVDFERSLGRQLNILLSHARSADEEIRETISEKVSRFRGRLAEAMLREHGFSHEEFEAIPLDELRARVYDRFATLHDVDSQGQVDRLLELVDLANEWLQVLASSRSNFQNHLVRTKTLVCGTCVGIGRTHYAVDSGVFHWVIIDEAARSTASELAIAMKVGKRVLLVGDHKQLAPIYEEDHLEAAQRKLEVVSRDDLRRSDFERAFLSPYGMQVGATLLTQYRMAPPIGNLVSTCFYDGLLKNGKRDVAQHIRSLPPALGTTVTWIDTSPAGAESYERTPQGREGEGTSYVNTYEIRIITELLQALISEDSFFNHYRPGEQQHPPIGVICMYAEQKIALIKRLNSLPWAREHIDNRMIKVDTVDSYQGKENDVIIVSLVRNNKAGIEGFLSTEQRVNVSLSRAKERLYVVGARRMWTEFNRSSPVAKVAAYIDRDSADCSFVEANELLAQEVI